MRLLTKGSSVKQVLHSNGSRSERTSEEAISIEDLPDLGMWKFKPGEIGKAEISDEEPDVYIENKTFCPPTGFNDEYTIKETDVNNPTFSC